MAANKAGLCLVEIHRNQKKCKFLIPLPCAPWFAGINSKVLMAEGHQRIAREGNVWNCPVLQCLKSDEKAWKCIKKHGNAR